MRGRNLLFLVCLLVAVVPLQATTDTSEIRAQLSAHVRMLASAKMVGRGYVAGGSERAANYIASLYGKIGLRQPADAKNYRQPYNFPVNTFPGKMLLQLDGKTLVPGRDYLVDAASASYTGKGNTIRRADLGTVTDKTDWKRMAAMLTGDYVWLLDNADSFCKKMGIRLHGIAPMLPAGCFIIPEKGKQMWTVLRETNKSTVLYVQDSVFPANPASASVVVEAAFREDYKSENVIGIVPGAIADSFIVFSAHYDHLGMMGSETCFPGASDNASGMAMLLYLASYYATHPQRYTMVFIAFSGEEAGLLGSAHFVKHPLIPLGQIRFLINTDIMGDATDGVTVVNATEYKEEFALLNRINDQHQYLPVIKSRGKAANSDHYHFAEAGVPAIFLYSNGGKGFYHDIYDRAEEITFRNIPGVALLLTDFVTALQHETLH
jgi:hypothetical protein